MKQNLIIAQAIGTLISSALLVIEPLTDYAFLSFEWPGITGVLVLGSSRQFALSGRSYCMGRECTQLRSGRFCHSQCSQRSDEAEEAPLKSCFLFDVYDFVPTDRRRGAELAGRGGEDSRGDQAHSRSFMLIRSQRHG